MLLKGAINAEKLIEMIDQCYDEIFVWDKNGKIVYLEHPAVWYTAEGGITALDVMLSDLEGILQ